MEEKHFFKRIMAAAVIALLLIPPAQLIDVAEAKLDCGPVTNKSNDLPRTVAIGTNPAGTGAHGDVEFMPVAELVRATRVYLAMLQHLWAA